MQLTFQSIKSENYDLAKEEYKNGKRALKRQGDGWGDINSEESLNLPRVHFLNCAFILRYMHRRGEVESVERLPFPHEIRAFERRELKSLASTLRKLYFPN